jgi:hypothetical protein
VEGAYGQVLKFFPGQFSDPLFHFPGGLVGKGERQDGGLGDAALQHVGDGVGDDRGLSGACSAMINAGPSMVLTAWSCRWLSSASKLSLPMAV